MSVRGQERSQEVSARVRLNSCVTNDAQLCFKHSKNTVHFQTPPKANTRSNFAALFSAKALATMVDLHISFDVEPDKSVLKWSADGAPE